ncbi:hypothetical protein QR680_009272 [Steinernema hermaphroditum]|uniref:DUF4604 domain-containing protein n=1 Tax=Steinernema hermaphroditum TaxID=289476 RepID=A0AA39M9L1_9BILA|nr:hypothetical protein QR680_009272 [Steinernema hermaphroditum]
MDKKLNYKQKQSIAWVDKGDPPFLQKVKAQLGYQEGSKLEDKLASTSSAHFNEDDREEDDILQLKEEDRPQIVVLNPESDLSQKEFDKEAKKRAEEEDRKLIEEGKITFKKPAPKREAKGDEKDEEDSEKKKSKLAKVQEEEKLKVNTNLLSFGDDEEDDEPPRLPVVLALLEFLEFAIELPVPGAFAERITSPALLGRLAAQCSTPCAMCGWTEEADAPEEELTLKGSELVIFGVVYSFTVLLLVVVFELVMPVVDNPDYPFYNKMPDYRFQRPSPHLI